VTPWLLDKREHVRRSWYLSTTYGIMGRMHGSVDVEHAVRHALLRSADLVQQSDAVLAEHLGALASIPLHLAADLCEGPGRDAVVRELAAQGTPEARAVLYAMAAANDGELERLADAAARSMLPAVADPPWLRDAMAPIELWRVIGLVGRRDPAEQAVLYVFRRARRAHGFLVEIEPGQELPREITWASNEDARAWLKKLKKGTWKNGIAYEVSFDDVGRGVSLLEGMMHNTVHAQLQALDDWPLAADLLRADPLPGLPSLLVLLRKSLRSALALDEWPYLDGTPWAPWRPVAAARSRPAAHTADGHTLTFVSTGDGLAAVRALAGSSPALRHAVDELYEAESVALAGGDGTTRAEAALRAVRFEALDRPELDPVRAWALASAGQTALVGSQFVEAVARLTEAYMLMADGDTGVPVVDAAELRRGINIATNGVQLRLGGLLSQLGAAGALSQLSDSELEQAPGLMNRLRAIGKGYVDNRQWEPATLCLDAAGMVGFLTSAVSPAHRLAYVEVIGAIADAKARQGDVLMGLRAMSDGLGQAVEALTAEPTPRSIKILRASLGMEALMPLLRAAPARHPLVVECETLRDRADATSFEAGPTLDESARRLLQGARILKAKFDEIIANNERN
jgi:hypothetical protein